MYSHLMSQFRYFIRLSISADIHLKIGKFMSASVRILQSKVELYADDVQRDANRTVRLDEIEKTSVNTARDTSEQIGDWELSNRTSSACPKERYNKEEREQQDSSHVLFVRYSPPRKDYRSKNHSN